MDFVLLLCQGVSPAGDSRRHSLSWSWLNVAIDHSPHKGQDNPPKENSFVDVWAKVSQGCSSSRKTSSKATTTPQSMAPRMGKKGKRVTTCCSDSFPILKPSPRAASEES
ncbi:hypothetical protein CDAR_196501 [Caerostris darwini]|uniref:Uncharacterized protein n=1 Tax=Caerostris darwini TaxID=1538125 RepID=A0AAV4PZZ0_9ARAC|nr:hypothetical protein CDAR_196501 [Caerostris darwini]